jgi:hypothetical protein
MEQLSETARAHRELEQAQSELRRTLEQLNHKVAEAEARLQPQAIVRGHPIALPLLAGLIGFLAGSDHRPRPLRWVAMGAVLGTVLAATHRRSKNSSDGTTE